MRGWKYLQGRFQCRTYKTGRLVAWNQQRGVRHIWLDLSLGRGCCRWRILFEENEEWRK
jgi:hypothetical protein